MSDATKNNDQHVNMDLDQDNLHTPLGHIPALPGELSFKLDNQTPFYFPSMMPPFIDFEDGNVAPPTEVDKDVYILDDDVVMDVDEILWQSGTTVRYDFNGLPTRPAVGDYLTIENATNPSNNGTFLVTNSPPGLTYVDVTNPARTDATDDEASDSPAEGKWTHADWDGAKPKDWVYYDGPNDVWIAITPQTSNFAYSETTASYWFFNGSGTWEEQNIIVPPASETTQGKAELATQAEVDAGTDDLRIITPLKLENSEQYKIAKELKYSYGNGAATNNTASYVTLARFYFNGTDELGVPSTIKAIAFTTATDYSLRVYDLTNAQVICEITGQVNTTPTIKDMGALSNLPTGEAIFEIQGLRNGGGIVQVDSLSIKFN